MPQARARLRFARPRGLRGGGGLRSQVAPARCGAGRPRCAEASQGFTRPPPSQGGPRRIRAHPERNMPSPGAELTRSAQKERLRLPQVCFSPRQVCFFPLHAHFFLPRVDPAPAAVVFVPAAGALLSAATAHNGGRRRTSLLLQVHVFLLQARVLLSCVVPAPAAREDFAAASGRCLNAPAGRRTAKGTRPSARVMTQPARTSWICARDARRRVRGPAQGRTCRR